MRLWHWISAFQILFYPGSHVREEAYQPLLKEIGKTTQTPIRVMDGSFFRLCNTPKEFQDPTLLIGHSLGGYMALLDAHRYPDSVQGVVLLHSHFNSRGRAIYPKVDQKKIGMPVLTVLASKDERLPIHVAVDDLFEKIQQRLYDKYYIINKGYSHFSGCTPDMTEETQKIAYQISRFLQDVETGNFTLTRKMTDVSDWDAKVPDLIPGILLSRSTSLFDALMQVVVLPVVWETWHWVWFLMSKPNADTNYFFETDRYIYMKTYNLPVGHIQNKLRRISHNKPLDFKYIPLPPIHPSILMWLTYPLFVSHNMTLPILKLPVNKNVTYYKIPHPNRLIEKQF